MDFRRFPRRCPLRPLAAVLVRLAIWHGPCSSRAHGCDVARGLCYATRESSARVRALLRRPPIRAREPGPMPTRRAPRSQTPRTSGTSRCGYGHGAAGCLLGRVTPRSARARARRRGGSTAATTWTPTRRRNRGPSASGETAVARDRRPRSCGTTRARWVRSVGPWLHHAPRPGHPCPAAHCDSVTTGSGVSAPPRGATPCRRVGEPLRTVACACVAHPTASVLARLGAGSVAGALRWRVGACVRAASSPSDSGAADRRGLLCPRTLHPAPSDARRSAG
jgi:hypothetical protein